MRKNYKYEVVENPFHGERHIAYAVSLETAVRTARRHDICTRGDCCCGGPAIRNADGSRLSDADLDRLFLIRAAMRNK